GSATLRPRQDIAWRCRSSSRSPVARSAGRATQPYPPRCGTMPSGRMALDRVTAGHLLARIMTNPERCGGHSCVRGMRIRVADVLELLAVGLSPAQGPAELTDLEREDLQACLLYAARRLAHPILRAA